jgi:fumarate hydratase class II
MIPSPGGEGPAATSADQAAGLGDHTPQPKAERRESDSLGTVLVPAEHYWGAQTQRSIHFFPFGQPMPLAVVHAFGELKAACAEVNRDLGRLEPSLCAAIVAAAEQVASGELDGEFPL